MTEAELKALEHHRAVLRTVLDMPDGVAQKAAQELLAKLHEMSGAFAGPAPRGRAAYTDWALKREAFEYMALQVMSRGSIAGKGLVG